MSATAGGGDDTDGGNSCTADTETAFIGASPSSSGGAVPLGNATAGLSSSSAAAEVGSQGWDPFQFSVRQPTPQCIRRVQQDVVQICKDPPPGCFVFPDDAQSTVVHCLLAGNADTPYEGGMFYFYLVCPDDYPINPPRVKILTGIGRCRFNPNLYQNGKVCLSILNTWSGPGWQPVHSIASVLMSIQSLMNEKPYHNEPGYELERYQGEVQAYNSVIQHETLRHAVLGMMTELEQGRLPVSFKQVMESIFLTMFEGYEEVCGDNLHCDGQPFRDPFNTNSGVFHYGALLEELSRVRARLPETEPELPES